MWTKIIHTKCTNVDVTYVSLVARMAHSVCVYTMSFKYTKTIAGKIFNHKKVVEGLDVDIGTRDMCCDCNTSTHLLDMSLLATLIS